MGVRLTVKQRSEAGGAEKPSVVILNDDIIPLGRDKTCQVVLAQQAVSRSHARILRDGTLFFLEDLGSAYGTQINGQKLPKGEKRLLKNGDLIAIAQFDVTFDRVAERAQEGASTGFVARKVVKDVMRGLSSGGESPYFRIMNGPREGERIEVLEAQEYVIGREDGVEIVINDDLISRRHAKIRRDWSGTHVEDLDSRNGIKVNKKKTKKKTLKDSDELEVGGIRMLYIDPTEVREAPVVLPEDEDERTVHTDTGESKADGKKKGSKKKDKKAKEEPPAEEPVAEEPVAEAPVEEPPAEAPQVEEPPAEEPPAEESPAEAPAEEPPADEAPAEDDAPEEKAPLIDFSNKQTLIGLGVVGVVALVAIVFLVLLLAGA